MADQSEFSYTMTGLHYSANDNEEVTASSDWEGTATGFEAVFGTLIVTFPLADTNASSGTCRWVGGAAPDDGSVLAAIAEGTWQRPEGEHRWNVEVTAKISNGDRLKGVGVVGPRSRTTIPPGHTGGARDYREDVSRGRANATHSGI